MAPLHWSTIGLLLHLDCYRRGRRLAAHSNASQASDPRTSTNPRIPRLRHSATDSNPCRALHRLCENRNSQPLQVLKNWIVIFGRPSRIGALTRRDENRHSLSCSRKQHPIGIQQITAVVSVGNIQPTASSEVVITPCRTVHSEIGVPRYASPIELQSLNLKFRGCVFEVKARPRVLFFIEKPAHWIYVNANIDRVRFKTLRL